MRTLVLLLILITLAACGKENTRNAAQDAELVQWAIAFESEIGVPTDGITIQFGTLDNPTIGMCYSWSNGDREIIIDRETWSTLTDLGKEELMYHELGHCALDLDHINSNVTTPENYTIYGSIMNQYWFGHTWFYEEYRDLYKQALKNNTLISF